MASERLSRARNRGAEHAAVGGCCGGCQPSLPRVGEALLLRELDDLFGGVAVEHFGPPVDPDRSRSMPVMFGAANWRGHSSPWRSAIRHSAAGAPQIGRDAA